MTHKTCSKCGKLKAIVLFYKRKDYTRKDGGGFRSECTKCNRADLVKRRPTIGLARL